MDGVAVVIPAFNAGCAVGQVIRGVCTHIPPERIIVVNDGSDDATAKEVTKNGAVLLEHAANRGKGAALSSGFAWCAGKGVRAVITMDADGQHSPSDIPAFIKAFRREEADIIIGSRMHDKRRMPWQRIVTNTLSSLVLSRLTRQRIPDSQSGFRLIAWKVLESVTLTRQRYDLESELLIKAAGRGFTIGAVPVTTIYGAEQSHFRAFKDTAAIITSLFRGPRWRREALRAAA